MFWCQINFGAQRVLGRTLVGIFNIALLLASQPPLADFYPSGLPGHNTKLVNVTDIGEGLIAERGFRRDDFLNKVRLWVDKVTACPGTRENFVRVVDQKFRLRDAPATRLFLIRSPPLLLVA